MAKRKLTIRTEHNFNWSHRKQNSYLYNKRASTYTHTHKFHQRHSISTCTLYNLRFTYIKACIQWRHMKGKNHATPIDICVFVRWFVCMFAKIFYIPCGLIFECDVLFVSFPFPFLFVLYMRLWYMRSYTLPYELVGR